METLPLCIYHGNCQDGFAAAWCVRKGLNGEVDFYPGVYQDAPPNVEDRKVIMVDFSYKRKVIEDMAKSAASIIILDHHESAAEDLSPWVISSSKTRRMLDVCSDLTKLDGNVIAEFDMERSGAGMAWDYFLGTERPPLINLVEDRDLWRFHYKDTRAAVASLFSYPYDFAVYDKLMRVDQLGALVRDGEAIERKHFKDVDELINLNGRMMVIGGMSIPVANIPHTLTSDAGHLMATRHPMHMAACYWDTPEGRVFSLRSLPDGPNVAQIAKGYGGGGHAHAAGFRMPIGWEGDLR